MAIGLSFASSHDVQRIITSRQVGNKTTVLSRRLTVTVFPTLLESLKKSQQMDGKITLKPLSQAVTFN